MKTFDPRVKLLAIMLATSLAIIFTDIVWMAGVAVVCVVYCFVFKADYKLLWNKLKKFVMLILGVSVLQIVFVRTGNPVFTIGEFTLIYEDGLLRGVALAFRFFVLMSCASVMAAENSRKVIASLSKMKLPYTFSFMIMITLRYIPFFAESFSDALTSMQLRGIELEKLSLKKKIKLYGHTMFPVVADAIVKSQDLSIAMGARGFGAMKTRTSYIEVKMNFRDYVASALLVCGAAVAVFYYYSV